MALDPKTVLGFCAPNRRIEEVEGGEAAFWQRMKLSGTRWIKWLYPDHSLANVTKARKLGYRNIVRLPGESIINPADVYELLNAWPMNVIELGNEPFVDAAAGAWPEALMKHLDLLEDIANEFNWLAVSKGVQLCTPGWNASTEPPDPTQGGLSLRFWNVYSRFSAVAVHCYGSVNFDGQLARVGRWQRSFNKPTYITEAGIAARDLIGTPPDPSRYAASQPIKATRYRDFTAAAAKQNIRAVTFFIDSGSTREWGTFETAGKYDPNGTKSYWLDDSVLPLVAAL